MAAVAEAEAEAAADLRSRLRISPATPTIVYKRARPSRTAGADGSCRTALFTSAATAPVAGPGKAESDGFAPVPSPAQERPQSAPEDSGEVECAPVSTQESSTLPPLVGESSGKVAQQEQQQQQEEGIASGSDAGAAAPVPTPEKVEYTPRRRWKKSTKGVLRFKVVKDKVMKPKITPKTATPRKVKKDKRKQTPEAEDGSQHVGAGGCNRARRKLDLDSSQNKTCFSRAELMGNLKDLAKSHGLSVEPTRRPRSKRGRKRKLMTVPYQGIPTGASSSSLVPHWGSDQSIVRHGNHGKRLLNKVLGLNQETLRVCDVLAKWDGSDSESFEGFDIGSGPEWDKTRHWFEHLVDIFIAGMDDLIGPRKFSLWGGSLIDSVVGTFLTQNVADNLSSHAFMNLAAKFPPRKRCHKAEDCSNTALLVDGVDENLNSKEASDTFDSADSDFEEYIDSEEEDGQDGDIKGHYGEEYNRLIENFIANIKERDISTWESDLMNLVKDKSGNPICTERTLRKFVTSLQQPVTSSIWKELREEAYQKGYSDKSGTSDAVDWESVLHAPIAEVANCIKVRGQHYILAVRIQVFLMHVNNAQDGNFDLDWLRYISREKAKKFLLSIYGIGMKSADCIRLLSLRHKAFPVDVNVARIVTRLGWVELQPLNGAEFHLVSSYPIMRDVQKYLWPRLCTIDKEKLYELHYLMITFGKVLCTKINPNCSACPFSANCKYYNSSFARKALPPPVNHEDEQGEQQASMIASGRFLLPNDGCMPSSQEMYQYQNENGRTAETPPIHNCEPIVEMPQSPEYEYEEAPNEQEDSYGDYLCDLEDTVPEGVEFDGEIDLCSSKHGLSHRSWTPNCGKDLVLINPKSGRNKKLKNIGRLRTEHNAYVLPDDHVILEEFEERVPEDICPYLLVVISCPDDYTVTGTVLIPCRTANRGKFPLNGTYFQENEVFADHSSSRHPITIPRECIGMLDRSIVYFGSSIHSITRGQTRRDIQECFKEGYVCVRGFHRRTRTPMRICGKLHATSTVKKETMKKEAGKKEAEKRAKRAKTSPVGKSKEKTSMAN